MDFEWTNRPSSGTKPVWAVRGEEPQTPVKRGRDQISPATPSFPTPSTPSRPEFGRPRDTPFLFSLPVPQTPHSPPWVPPQSSSPEKVAFPLPDLHDVDMSEVSPAGKSPEKEQEGEDERTMAVGALRRVFNKRRGRDRRRLARVDDGDESNGEESGDEDHAPLTRKTTNHYTLNMAGLHAQPSDLPFRLLGYVQVGFNGALAVLGIYLLVIFFLTVQRDVEYRVAEYSMEIVQDIAQCNLLYKTNLCAQGLVPAMAAQCAAWETCMNRDPSKVGRAKVTMEVIGEVVNSFVEPISWKTLAFVISSLTFFTLFINSLPSFFRPPAPHPVSAPHHVPGYPMAPAISYPAVQGYLPPPEWNNKPWKYEDDEVAPRRRRLEDGQIAKVK